jgi:hypothetical protein
MNTWKKGYVFIFICLLSVAIVGINAAVPQSTPRDTIQTYQNDTNVIRKDYVVIDRDLFFIRGGVYYNTTEAIESLLNINATNEWGLVLGTTGDWFNYTELSGATPVYIGLQVHPDNVTLGVLPQVYDKDATHWQLALYWYNGTQYNKDDVLVMYYAHIEWNNPTGDTYIEPNGEEPL